MREMFHIRIQHRHLSRAASCNSFVYRGWRPVLIALILALSVSASAQQLRLGTAPGGISIVSGGGNNYSTSFGRMNALGVGNPSVTGVTDIPLSNGALYYTTFHLIIPNMTGNHKGFVTAYMSSNFGHPAALVAESCPVNDSCSTSDGYSAISTVAGNPSTILPAPGVDNQTVTAGLAIFIPDNNGNTSYAGTDNATITFNLYDNNTGRRTGQSVTLTLTSQTVQTAVQLTLSTAPNGVTITPASDFNLNFGNVNGLGIGPASGLATIPVAGGMIYHTPYLLNPVFSAFRSTTATITVYVSDDFAHPTILSLQDASASDGPYTAISKSVFSRTQITTTAANRTSITRHLGLYVSGINGPTAFNGTDTATLTFTLTVP
ncbi:MAG TPA: hypothetical protein VG897_00755 [Terriglobales bacterium]|nr:hypothetical protein [Terriglobales bacterium]